MGLKGKDPQEETFISRCKHTIFGQPKDLHDRSIFHNIALIPFLAWVGLGADGLSSSAYGPEEAFRALGEHKYLAIFLVLLMAFTVFIISAAYRHIIDKFPHGGGGYVVASKLLGRKAGLISGCALLVDYILTITISIAAAGDAIFSFLPASFAGAKLAFEFALILGLSSLNIRGVKESVVILTPIFIIFLITHALTLGLGIIGHASEMTATAAHISQDLSQGVSAIGPWALFLLFIHAYSLGGGTYTGIEAVSNGLPIMREPRVKTAKTTMTYMAISLAITASGLLLCYLLWNTHHVPGKTLNAVLLTQISEHYSLGTIFVIITLLAEGLLLVVAAQAGFIDGPRVLSNMAKDSWMPHQFATLSERLTTANGIVLMGGSALAALIYTHGNVSMLVVMYSINVFVTFSLSIFGMLLDGLKNRAQTKLSHILTFFVAFVLCFTILVITVYEKLLDGGWVTIVITGALVLLCLWIKKHYYEVVQSLHHLNLNLDRMEPRMRSHPPLNPKSRTAGILVGSYGGLGIHTMQTILKTFPSVFQNLVFISIGVVDSGKFKGEDAVEQLEHATDHMLDKYVKHAESLGVAATKYLAVGTDIVHEAEVLCKKIAEDYPHTTFFTGKIIFEDEKWFQRLLHNETALSLQKRLQLEGYTLVILPAKVS